VRAAWGWFANHAAGQEGDVPSVNTPSRRFRAGLLAVPMILVVALGAWLLLRDDDPGALGALRGLPAVGDVRTVDGELTVRLVRGSDVAEVRAALDAIPSGAVGAARLGAVEVPFDRPEEGELGPAAASLVALARIPVADSTIELPTGSRAESIVATVGAAAQAAPLARTVLDQLGRDGSWPPGVDGLRVGVREQVPGDSVVTLGPLGSGTDAARAALNTAAVLAPGAEVHANRSRVELRVLVPDAVRSGAIWRRAARGLGARFADDVRLYVDAGTAATRRPVLFGVAGDDPDPALALLRDLTPAARRATAATDRSYADVTVTGRTAAEAAVATAAHAGVKRLALSWPSGDGRHAASLDDAPAVVGQLLPGVARATPSYAVGWEKPSPERPARLSFNLRGRVDQRAKRLEKPGAVRALMDEVREIAWPGVARFQLPLSPCPDSPGNVQAVYITSTADGRARTVKPGTGCTEEAAVAQARRDWNATTRERDR